MGKTKQLQKLKDFSIEIKWPFYFLLRKHQSCSHHDQVPSLVTGKMTDILGSIEASKFQEAIARCLKVITNEPKSGVLKQSWGNKEISFSKQE
jgi:hypothetical protein